MSIHRTKLSDVSPARAAAAQKFLKEELKHRCTGCGPYASFVFVRFEQENKPHRYGWQCIHCAAAVYAGAEY